MAKRPTLNEEEGTMEGMLGKRDIISITDFSADEILRICEVGERMYELEKEIQCPECGASESEGIV